MSYPSSYVGYAELQITSNFSFLRGASHPDELVVRASELGLGAVAITDRNSLAGVVRAHVAAKEAGINLVVGCRLDCIQDATPAKVLPIKRHQRNNRYKRSLGDESWRKGWENSDYSVTEPIDAKAGMSLLAYPLDRQGYGDLCQLLTLGRRRAPKGECYIDLGDVETFSDNMIFVVLPPIELDQDFALELERLGQLWQGRCYLAANNLLLGGDEDRLDALNALAEQCKTPMLATNDVHYHDRDRKPVQDVLTCVRHGCTIDMAGYRLFPNAERCLKPRAEMAALFAKYPQALAGSVEIAKRCHFSLDELRYEYPKELQGETGDPYQELVRLVWSGACWRYGVREPAALPQNVTDQLNHELELIQRLSYAPYFLTVYDVVRYARERQILCQGRGSAANSVVCYCLGITSIDPVQMDLLFERFISANRNEPPDIDVDFEHERREEVFQYIYQKYGRGRAGLAATVTCYRTKGALRDVGKVMGLSEDVIAAVSSNISGWNSDSPQDERVAEMGLDSDAPRLRQTLDFVKELRGFPRHLSQHVGGFVLTDGPLDSLVPIQNANMADRTVVEWDKDDLEALGILKVDILALGMLSCLRRCFDLIDQHYGKRYDLATLPKEDSRVYDMLCMGDSVGVFQVESRAQINMLPRLKPRKFYDLVIEVAIVRPGPIQGDMVHPYLRRRNKEEPVECPSKELETVLGKTMGVPLFQEQAMKIAIVAAGFTPEEADKLRRAMATFKKRGEIAEFGDKLRAGMTAKGYDPEFAERCFRQLEGFGSYGFPESHAASFALLVYASSWVKCHYPEVFAVALLNSQPMGFYAPAQIIRDVRDHGVEVLPADVNYSHWDNTLEIPTGRALAPVPRYRTVSHPRPMAVRLGFRQIKSVGEVDAVKLLNSRSNGYPDLINLWRRTNLKPAPLEALARGDAFGSMQLNRREALWAIKALPDEQLPLFAAAAREQWKTVEGGKDQLPWMSVGEHVADDYRALRLSLKAHPMALVRKLLDAEGMLAGRVRTTQAQSTAQQLWELNDGSWVQLTGLIVCRQRPGTSSGVIFITLEDETGVANLVVWPSVFEERRRVVMGASLVQVDGRLQKVGTGDHQVIHIVANKLADRSSLLGDIQADSFDAALANADEVRRPIADERQLAHLSQRDEQPLRFQPTKPAPSNRHPRNTSIRFPIRHATRDTHVGGGRT